LLTKNEYFDGFKQTLSFAGAAPQPIAATVIEWQGIEQLQEELARLLNELLDHSSA
jgi:hypothetical protein